MTQENQNTQPKPASKALSAPAGSDFERECQRRYEAERDALNREHNVIEDLSELTGWQITGLRRWKDGVVQYTAFRRNGASAEQKMGYAKDEVFSAVQLPQNTQGDSQSPDQ
jgi:hypothetical protein